jgi:hypothetical protein
MNKRLRNLIPFLIACWIIIVLNLAVICFHILVVIKIIPYNVVWAGRLTTENEMYVFESVSILTNLLLILAVLIKMKRIKENRSAIVVDVLLWIFVVIFFMNTLGNLAAESRLERFIATPLTFILAILCLRIAIERREKQINN